MARLAYVFGTAAIIIQQAAAVDYNYSASVSNTANFASQIVLCNNTFNAANGTGIYTITPGVPNGGGGNGTAFGSDIKWALALAQNQVVGSQGYGLQGSLLISPGKANFFDDVSLGYDACGIAIDPAALTSNTFLRGQSDNGSCLQTLDRNCKTAIQDLVNNVANNADQAIALAGSVRSTNVLPGICSSIASALAGAIPKECSPFFNSGTVKWINGFTTLTEYPNTTTSNLAQACTTKGYDGSTDFYNILTVLTVGYSDATYNLLSTVTWPLLTIFLPVVNGVTSSSVISSAYTELNCLRGNRINAGSRTPDALPAPQPVDYGSLNSTTNSTTSSNTTTSSSASNTPAPAAGLTGGAIAGIVIGVIVILAIIAAAAFFIMRRKKRQQRAKDVTELDSGYAAEKRGFSTAYSEVNGDGLHEMNSNNEKPSELSSPQQPRHELPGGHQKYELDSGRAPIELPADYPKDKPGT